LLLMVTAMQMFLKSVPMEVASRGQHCARRAETLIFGWVL